MALGQRLTALRKAKRLTQEEIAKKMHLTRSTYAQYEVDRRVPEYATLEKLADFFGVSIDYLVGRTDEKQIKESRAGYLSDDQVLEAAEIFSRLNKDEQENLLDFMRRMAKKDK